MNIKNTEKFMQQGLSGGLFGSYALLVYKNGQEKLITSPDVNEETYLNTKNDFRSYDYNNVIKMRENIHNAIYSDFIEEGLI